MTSTQNGLRELEAKVKGLPNQDALLRRRTLLRGIREQLQQRQAEIEAGIGQVGALRIIQDKQSLLLDEERRALAAARNKLQELLNLLEQSEQDNNQVSAKLEAIKRAGKVLSDAVKTHWSQVCQDLQERASALKPLAQRLSVNLLTGIQELERLLQANTGIPPTAPQIVEAIVAARKAVAAEMATLDMTGPIETFLRAAQNRNGDPQALLDPEVRGYLDAHPALWKSLRVVLG